MPRPGQPAASTLRNRNRITNKSRLKIVRGNLDVEPIIPDEDEEKNRLLQSVAGVDQEDANEHHLQAVLSQAAVGRPDKDDATASAAFIPIPDHAGVADDYEKLYPPRRWKDPVSYVQATSGVEELCTGALADGCTYYMDERDKDWLDRNNEEARGEGTSAQGCVSPSGIRVSGGRSAKAKGKEPEEQPTVISEDEFELVMGLYEKITHDKTEFLHHGLENGMSFPEFLEYQETFSNPLPPATFAAYKAPSWIPECSRLLCLARIVYPYWKERRLERAGHRIIPVLNLDDSDTLNESYVCFRRRETKAIRKTRAAQVTSSDKLARLEAEFHFPVQLAQSVLGREQVKRDLARQSQAVWEQRMKLVELRVKYPALGEKIDEELLVEKERPGKKSDVSRVRLASKHDSAQAHAAARLEVPGPRERSAIYQTKIETVLGKQKELDQHWEDHIDAGYVTPLSVHSSRLFKYINPASKPPSPRRPIRLRYGRGGRAFIDRRHSVEHHVPKRRRRLPLSESDEDEDEVVPMEVDEESDRRVEERWRFDADDGPHYGPGGSDEQDRILVDDYDANYLRHAVSLLNESDITAVLNDPTLPRITPDGKKEGFVPFRLGVLPPILSGRTLPPSPVKGVAPSTSPVVQKLTTNDPLLATQQVPVAVAATRVMPSPQVTQNGRAAMTMPHIDMNKIGYQSGAAVAAVAESSQEAKRVVSVQKPAENVGGKHYINGYNGVVGNTASLAHSQYAHAYPTLDAQQQQIQNVKIGTTNGINGFASNGSSASSGTPVMNNRLPASNATTSPNLKLSPSQHGLAGRTPPSANGNRVVSGRAAHSPVGGQQQAPGGMTVGIGVGVGVNVGVGSPLLQHQQQQQAVGNSQGVY